MKRISTLSAIVAVLFCVIACEKAAPLAPAGSGVEEDYPFEPWNIRDMSDRAIFVDGPAQSVTASIGDEAGTRTMLSMNADQTRAEVLWKSGDGYYSITPTNNNTGYYPGHYTTTQDGVRDATFTLKSGYVSGEHYCIYPDASVKVRLNPVLFGINLPSEQTAVAGGVSSGLMLSYAHPATASAHACATASPSTRSSPSRSTSPRSS